MEIKFTPFRYPLLYLDILVLAGIAVLFCLLAIWAGISRRSWFLRAGAIVLALLALLPIQGHQPALMLAFILPALAATVAWLNRRGIGPPAPKDLSAASRRLNFSLRDLLLVVLLCGLVCYGITVLIERRRELDWQRLFAGAPSIWLAAVLCYLLAYAQRWRIGFLLALLVLVPLIAALELWLGNGWGFELVEIPATQGLNLDVFAQLQGTYRIETFVCMALTSSVFALLLTVMLLLAGHKHRMMRAAFALPILVSSLSGASLYWQMIEGSPIRSDDPSRPNSYPQLLQLARRVQTLNANELALTELSASGNLDRAAVVEELKTIYAAGLRLVRQPGHMPFNADVAADDLRLDEMMSFRVLARAWGAEGRSLASQDDLHGAAEYHLSNIELGTIIGCRELLVHAMVGMACEEMGKSGLASIRRELPADEARHVITRLIASDCCREPYEAVAARDKQWVWASSAWRSRLAVAIEAWGEPGWSHPDESNYSWMFRQRDATMRLLIADLAVRLHRTEHGNLPAALNSWFLLIWPRSQSIPSRGSLSSIVQRATTSWSIAWGRMARTTGAASAREWKPMRDRVSTGGSSLSRIRLCNRAAGVQDLS